MGRNTESLFVAGGSIDELVSGNSDIILIHSSDRCCGMKGYEIMLTWDDIVAIEDKDQPHSPSRVWLSNSSDRTLYADRRHSLSSKAYDTTLLPHTCMDTWYVEQQFAQLA